MPGRKYNREEILEEWLNFYPLRQIEYELNHQNLVVLLIPQKVNWIVRKIFPRLQNKINRINLDEIGTFIWTCLDGQQSLRTICDKLENHFGERVHHCQERTVIFTQQLYKQKFIKIYLKKEEINTVLNIR